MHFLTILHENYDITVLVAFASLGMICYYRKRHISFWNLVFASLLWPAFIMVCLVWLCDEWHKSNQNINQRGFSPIFKEKEL
jgi:hypothetical protein